MAIIWTNADTFQLDHKEHISIPQEGIIVVQLRPNCGKINMFKPTYFNEFSL